MGYTLQYKTFDSLLADIKTDFKSYDLENFIDPQDLIRVARWVTRDLGLRIYKTKDAVLEVENFKVCLPDDFFVFNYGLMCGKESVVTIMPQGVTMDMVPYPRYKDAPGPVDQCESSCPTETVDDCNSCGHCSKCVPTNDVEIPGYNPLKLYGDPCQKPRVFMDCKGDSFELIQIVHTQKHTWEYMLPLRLINSTNQIAPCCPNLFARCKDEIRIKDGFIYTNFKTGKIYISYEGSLENEDGELLVPDHEILTVYYEYKLKERLMENMYMSGEDTKDKMMLMSKRLHDARLEARNLVSMPELSELETAWRMNRKAFNDRYVNMFRASNWLTMDYGFR